MKLNTLIRSNLIIAALIISLFSPGIYARSTTLVEPDPVRISCNLSAQKMKIGIRTGGAMRGWTVVDQAPGNTKLRYVKGNNKHIIRVNISYTENTFAVTYKDSINLDFNYSKKGVRRIHPNAIGWMRNLSGDIQMQTDNQCYDE